MLDNLKTIHDRDSRDMLGVAGKRWRLLSDAAQTAAPIPEAPAVDAIVFYGQEAALASLQLARVWSDVGVPLEIARPAVVPPYTGPGTVCLVADYEGVDPGTDVLLGRLQQRGAQCLVLTANDGLSARARSYGFAVRCPGLSSPARSSEAQAVMAVALELHAYFAALAGQSLPASERKRVAANLQAAAREWEPTVSTAHNYAKQLALELAGKSVHISGGPLTGPAASAWKVFFNRNAKHIAWASHYPAAERDELSGWSRQPVIKPYACVSLMSSFEDDTVRARLSSGRRLLSGMRPEPLIVEPAGDSLLEQSLNLLVLGEFVSVYLALLGGLDPAATDILDAFDKEVL